MCSLKAVLKILLMSFNTLSCKSEPMFILWKIYFHKISHSEVCFDTTIETYINLLNPNSFSILCFIFKSKNSIISVQ